ncbi:hypothetical protein RHSIM_Rhsim08G0200800 [Rhododendron simsii]|uniref:RBR-type E3 ubiquitin transferase n=1 Tax=Rhododendron simsii TaxID=118357 RepID=A0A834LGE0_RHOSS|nr:hypothetical protein RHSIM_Rhsim08G0200800 [Rhododendron simsii]
MATSQEPISDPQFVDDFYFSALSHAAEDHQLFPISDSTYAEELQFQESLMSSLITPQPAATTPPQSNDDEPTTTTESGESSTSFCEICVDKKDPGDMLLIKSCSHSFCSDCVSKHVTARIQSNTTLVPCPALDCGTALEFVDVGAVVPPHVAARWDEMLCEALIPASEKFYCPFKDCSAMMLMEEGVLIRESECPVCHRLFCATCYVGWHAGIGCEEFGKLNEDERGREDLLVREMAKSQSWMRCPHCKFYVEKTEGCLHINCRTFKFVMALVAGADSNSAMPAERLGANIMAVVGRDHQCR